MTATILFLAGVGAIIAWWLSHQRLMSKPWLEEGPIGFEDGTDAPRPIAAKIGLGVFLAVVGSLFALFISAYSMRMHMGDWRPLPAPPLLWLNTGMLILSSLALHQAQAAAGRGRIHRVRTSLLAGGTTALAFIAGQFLAWWQLIDAGYVAAANPANAFFYLITGLHGLHLIGGLVGLGRTGARAWRRDDPAELRLGVELCAMYWHFLLLVWLLLFGLLFA